MPILPAEPICFPLDLLGSRENRTRGWFLAYTKSRQEKLLMRYLRYAQVAHYGPQIKQRYRSPNGRIRTSMVPLFPNYIFVCGNNEDRYRAICTGCVTRIDAVVDVNMLIDDLLQIQGLIDMDVPLSLQSTLSPGTRVRVTSGSFKGYEGVVEHRHSETHLIVSVRFMDQGVSVKLDDCQLERC
jgi:transcription antitermination factor NusG